MKRKIGYIVIGLSFITALFFMCVFYQINNTFHVTKFEKFYNIKDGENSFKIQQDEVAKFSNGINFNISGEINGLAIIGYGPISDSIVYTIDTVRNNFNVKFRNDWYSDSCFLVYQPINSTEGHINIKCKIYSSKKSFLERHPFLSNLIKGFI